MQPSRACRFCRAPDHCRRAARPGAQAAIGVRYPDLVLAKLGSLARGQDRGSIRCLRNLTIGITEMKVLIKSAWGSDESTKAAFAFLHANAFAKAGHDVQIFLLGEAVNLMRSETMNAVTPVGLLTFLTVRFGFVFAMVSVSASMLATLIPVAMAVLRPRRTDEYDSVERAA